MGSEVGQTPTKIFGDAWTSTEARTSFLTFTTHFSLYLRFRPFRMPLVSNRLGKVQKHIAKKKGKGVALHENSRDSKRLQAASARDNKLNRLAAVREKQNRTYGEHTLALLHDDTLN